MDKDPFNLRIQNTYRGSSAKEPANEPVFSDRRNPESPYQQALHRKIVDA